MTPRELARRARRFARRLAVGCTCVSGVSWWAVSYVATGGLSLVVGTVCLVASAVVGAFAWVASGE